jgi:ELWxxDGT repeat protein
MRRLGTACLLLLLSATSSSAATGTASLLEDIFPSEVQEGNEGGGLSGPLLSTGQAALFFASEPSAASELWVSDGTIGGTQTLRSATLKLVLGLAGKAAVLSLETDSRPGETLWRSDGTRAGTFPLLAPDQANFRLCSHGTTGALGGVLFFGLRDRESCKLWRTDGTVAGTRPFKDLGLDNIGDIRAITAGGGTISFVAGSVFGTPTLWRSDGTAAGTFAVRDFVSEPQNLTRVGSRLYFIAGIIGEGAELWTSDGTAAGTRPLTHFIPPQPFPDAFQRQPFFHGIDGILYFLADDVTGGLDLWRSDGTEAGTRRVTAFGNATPFSERFSEQQIAKLGSRLVFVATDGIHGDQLWTSGGTPESTAPLPICPVGGCLSLAMSARLVKLGNRIVFPAVQPGTGPVVWSTDGTAAGSHTLLPSCAPHCGPKIVDFALVANRILFVLGDDGPFTTWPAELWQTDGTAQGTVWLASLFAGPLGTPLGPVTVGNRTLFFGGWLWSTDGTPEGTGQIIRLGAGGYGSDPHGFAAQGDAAWFAASDGQNSTLWRSAGTPQTTQKLADNVSSFAVACGLAFFPHADSSLRLWRSDGTAAGTYVLPWVAGGDVEEVFPIHNEMDQIAFILGTPDGYSLWSSDGTPAGTRELLPILSYPQPRDRISVGPYLLGLDGDGVNERFLWRTDGTPAGTRTIALAGASLELSSAVRLGNRIAFAGFAPPNSLRIYILDDSGSSLQPLVGYGAPRLAVLHDTLYFMQGNRLIKSDGTASGTVAVKTFDSGSSESLSSFAPLGDRLYFSLSDPEHGSELWSTDGTAAGTVLVRDIVPGPGSSSPSELATADGRLFFNANDGVHGFELWESDGTEAGTRMVQDIAPGAASSRPREIKEAGGHLFFSADDGARGREPWALPLNEPAGCHPSDRVLCLGGGRFQVEVRWLDFQRHAGPGHAVSLAADTGTFWFFDPNNVELVVKALDGRGIDGHFWIFYGALSNVEYTLLVTDTQTGASRLYRNPQGRLGSVADTYAFGPLGASLPGRTEGPGATAAEPLIATHRSRLAKAACAPSSTRLCLQGGRFAVEVLHWRDFQSRTGAGTAVPLAGGDTGTFWFFDAANTEVILKVLDGRLLNGKFWVFYGALSNVEYTLQVTDTETGRIRTYTNPLGRLASVADTEAF